MHSVLYLYLEKGYTLNTLHDSLEGRVKKPHKNAMHFSDRNFPKEIIKRNLIKNRPTVLLLMNAQHIKKKH